MEGIILSQSITPYDITEIYIPDSYIVSNISDTDKGLIVEADEGNTISLSVVNYNQFSGDSYLALPLIEYYNVSEYIYYAITPNVNSSCLKNRVLIVSGFNETSVTIMPTQMITIPSDLSPTGEDHDVSPSDSITVRLNQFQTLLIESENSLTGTQVISSKPITFLSGHQCAIIPGDAVNGTCDLIVEQLPPTMNWGKRFILPLLSSRQEGSYLTILASQPNTVSSLWCIFLEDGQNTTEVSTMTNEGDFSLLSVSPDDVICSITSNNPILVAMFATSQSETDGDPFMMMINPLEQYTNGPISFAPINDNFTSNYLNLAIVGHPNHVLLDGMQITDQSSLTSVYTSNGALLGYGVQLNATDNHTLSVINNSTTIAGWIYGFDFSVSYGQSIDMNLLLTG